VECPAANLILVNFSGDVPVNDFDAEHPSYLPTPEEEAYYEEYGRGGRN
jgi:hypothetical protein